MTAPTTARGFTEETIAQLIAERGEPDWMTERRRAAWQAFNNIPMPTLQDEEWRRTNLRTLKLDAPSPLGIESVTTSERALAGKDELGGALTLVDAAVEYSWLRDDLKQQGVVVTDLRTALTTHPQLIERYFMTHAVPVGDSKFAALHGAFWDNGAFVYVPKGVAVEIPIGVIVESVAPGRASLTHTLVVLERDSQLKFVEELRGGDGSAQAFSSRAIELIMGDGSTLDFTTVQRFGPTMYDFYTIRAVQGKETNLTLHVVELGAQLTKGRVEAMLQGAGANAKLNGLYLGDGKQHYDRFTLQEHVGANTTSDLLFKGVLTDTARSVYSGFIRVHPGAKQTRAYQQNRNILLSRTARADSIPNLEISENDILGCTHGATVGKVDEEQLFYLMCRGLDRTQATQLLVEGFVEELIQSVPLTSMRQSIHDEFSRRVAQTTAQLEVARSA
jgi:Fe-S cluster assembly protein SufD